jgi:macrolide-specific efflux system membrane fusion protein
MNERKYLGGFLGILYGLAIAGQSFAVQAATSNTEPVEVESVVLRLLEEAEVPAQEAGVVIKVLVHEGQRVKQGQLLAQVDDQVARLAEQAADAQFKIAQTKATSDIRLRFAQKALEVSEAELRRSTESIERFAKSVSQSQLDVERLTVQKNRLESEQAEHDQQVALLEMNAKENELSAAKEQVARRRIEAPFDGVVVQIYVHTGEWVEPGRRALRIVNVDHLKAEGFVSAERATSVLPGQVVELAVALGGGPTLAKTGAVVFVSPEVDPITGQVRVWGEIDNRDGNLRPGQSAKMNIKSP